MLRARVLIGALAALYGGIVIFLAFIPTAPSEQTPWFIPLAVFIPIGILLLMLLGRRRWWAAVAFSVLGAVWLEAAQSIWMPTGHADPVHVLLAAAGAVIGVGAGLAIVAIAPTPAPNSQSLPARI